MAALGLGLAQGAYELARAYARTRVQFGRAIARFQAVQFKLADMATEIAAGRALTYHAAWLEDRGRPFAHEASMAKLYTAELACRVADEAVQIHGGYGYMDEYASRASIATPRCSNRRGHERDPAPRDRARTGPRVIFEQIVWRDLGCAAYVVGCQGVGEAIVVDPPLDVREVLAACRRHDAGLVG